MSKVSPNNCSLLPTINKGLVFSVGGNAAARLISGNDRPAQETMYSFIVEVLVKLGYKEKSGEVSTRLLSVLSALLENYYKTGKFTLY